MYLFMHRTFDILFSIFAIAVFTIPMLIIALLIKIDEPTAPILFKQKRLGLHGKLFDVYKFRTMIPNAEVLLNKLMEEDEALKEEYLTYRKLQNDPRISKIGHFLRKTSLDELPQFFNVLFGDMSIVGPRPYINGEFKVFPSRYERNLITSIRPGITGYWQTIPERHETTFESRVETDIEYIQKKSFLLDLKIIFKTISVMVLRKGA